MSKPLVEQLERIGVFSVCRPKSATKDEDNPSPLLSLTTNNVSTYDIKDALMTANVGLHHTKLVRLREYVVTRIVEIISIHLFPSNKERNKKTFSILFSPGK